MKFLSAWAMALVLLLVPIAGCGGPDASSDSITARLLIESNESEPRWIDDVTLPTGGNAYELLKTAVGGDLEAKFSAEFGSHFVTKILDAEPKGDSFWGLFIWNTDVDRWEPSMVGADMLTVEDRQTIGWAIVEFNSDIPQLPTARP